MSKREKCVISVFIVSLIAYTLCLTTITVAQNETDEAQIIERYKQMLNRKPKEGSTFDRLYQFYLEGAGLYAMVVDYQAEAAAKPDAPNLQLILGHIHKRLGKDTEAIKAYQRAVTLSPNDYYPHFALGHIYTTKRQYEQAINALTKAAALSEQTVAATPDDRTAIYKTLGRAYFHQDRVDAAITTWTKIAELDPQNIFARIELADLFREQELYPQAIAQHEAITEIKKDDPYRVCLSLREIGKIHEDTGDYEAARARYDAALALTAPGNWLRKDLQHRIIGIYAADADWKGLIAYYQGKLEAVPNDPELIGLQASAYIENQQLDEGITAYQKGLELAPTDAELRLNLIAALRSAEKLEDAAAAYEVLSEQQPDDFGIYRELGKLYLELQDEGKAKSAYQRMIDSDPENASTYLILAEIYTGHEWTEDAVASYQKAISLAPDNLDYIEYFGEFYIRQGSREQAIETWNQIVAGEKGIAENYDRLAQLLDTKDFGTEALTASRKAVELMPEAYRYREALAKRLMQNKAYDAAITEYTKAIKLAPNEFFAEQMDDQRIELYRRQGTLVDHIEMMEVALEKPGISDADIFAKHKRLTKMYLKLENITYALEVLLKAKALRPDDVTVNRWLAEIYVKQGKRDDANAIYTGLVDIDSTNAREYYTHIARLHLNAMDLEAAKTAAKQIVAHSPRNPEGHQMFAEIAKQAEDYEAAIDSLKDALRLRPEAIDIRSELADTYKVSGRLQEAISQYWRCWELSDNLGDKLAFLKPLSEVYYDSGRHGEFEEKLKQLSKSNTSSIGPVLALAELYRVEGDLPSARFQLARALDRDREHPELLERLVKVNFDLGDIADALTYQQRLVKAHPGPAQQQKLGELLFDMGRQQEAIQAWSKVLHAKNKPLEAEIKLATLLIEHGLVEEALFSLDRAAEKATGPKSHIVLYQIGSMLVEMNEFARAKPIFQRILQMPKPSTDSSASIMTSQAPLNYGMNKLNLARNISQNIQRQPYGVRTAQVWQPNTFDEAQAGALARLKTIMEEDNQLSELVEQFETNAAANPKDTQTLELLGALYTLTNNLEKTAEITEKLIAISPNNSAYQVMQLDRLNRQQQLDYDILKKQFDEMSGLTPEARHWYTIEYANRLFYSGKAKDAEKLLDELKDVNVLNLSNNTRLANILMQMRKTDAAEKVISQFPISTTGQLTQQQRFYEQLTTIYLREGQIDKAVALYWKFSERNKPRTTGARRVVALSASSYTYGGYTPIQSGYPSPTLYYNQNRLEYLQQFFNQLWMNDQQEALYATFKAQLDTTQGRDRIYPLLAMSYCYWWEGRREEAQEILSTLQLEFPNDLTLKLNTVFVSIQTGEIKTALALLKELTEADARNRRQYYDLTLQLVVHTGDTVSVRELVTKILNSPSGVRELYQFSQKLQQTGLTQYAIAVAQRATTLAMRERDPNLLVQLSQHLSTLGRGQDAARLATRALRFANQRGQHGQLFHSRNMQQAVRLAGRASGTRDRESKLVEAIERNPKSFQGHIRLASLYESQNQIQKASDAYDAALILRPTDSMTRQRYAEMLQRSGRAKNAVTQYVILLKENVNALPPNYWEVIRTFLKAGEVNTLISTVKEMLETGPRYGRSYDFARMAAEECTRNNNAKAAVEIYEKMVEINWERAYQQLVYAYVASGKRDKAIQLLRDKLRTKNPEIQVQVVLKMAEFDETLDEIKTLLKEYEARLPEDKISPPLCYFVATLKIVTDDIEGADPLVKRLLEDAPPRMRLRWLNTLADTYRGKSDREREIRMLEAATQNVDPQEAYQLPGLYEKLGSAYAQKGEKEASRNALRKMGTLQLMRRGGSRYWEKENIARKYVEHEMWDDAEVLLTEVINDPSVQQYYLERAQEQLMTIQQRRDGLTETPESSGKIEVSNIGMQRSMAQQYMRRNQIEKAVEIYEQIAKVMPEDLESRSQLATLYSRQNQHDKAIDVWKALLEVDPENTRYQDGFIDAYQKAGRIGDAIELAQKYIDDEAKVGVHYSRLAKLYAADGEVDAAITHYQKAIELTPGDGRVYQELGQLYLRKNDLDAAEKAFQEALQYAAHDGERQNIERQLINLYRRQGKLEEMLKEAEAQGGLTFEMQMEQARNYSNQGKLDEAVAAYKKALEMTTRDWERENAERQLMHLYRRQGTLEEVLKEAEKNDTLTFTMQAELARHYRNKGESEKAISAYKQALNMTTQNHERNRIAIELMQEYVQIGENDLAIELYESASQSDSNSRSMTHGSSGFIVMFSGDRERDSLIKAFRSHRTLAELKALFEKKLEENANNPAALEMIAEIYRNEDKHAEAAEAYQALCKAQPSNIRGFYYAAAAWTKSGQPELANDLLNQGETALSSNSKKQDLWLLMSLGSICFEGEMYTPAITFFKDAVVISGSRSRGGINWEQEYLYEMLGKSYRATEQYEAAIKAYQQIANVSRDSHRKQAAEKAIKEIHREGNLYETRIPKQLKKLEENPDDIDTRLALAKDYVSSGKVEEGIAQYEKLSELQPKNAEWYKVIGDLYRKIRQQDKPDRLTKAAAAYEKAIILEPTVYMSYSQLADTHKKQADLSKAEAVYRRALDAPLTPAEHDAAVTAISKLYSGEAHFDKRIAVLEELSAKTEKSAVLYKMLGDAYREAGNTEKAAPAYMKWLEIRQKAVNQNQHASEYQQLAEKLLKENIMPETALAFAKTATGSQTDWTYVLTLGHAYLANGQYEAALREFKRSLDLINQSGRTFVYIEDLLLSRISEMSKRAADKKPYVEIVDKLLDALPDKLISRSENLLALAKFCLEHGLREKAAPYINKAGFIAESAWLTLGPFDNTEGVGYNTVYIPEDAVQVDTTAKYDGADGEVSWQKLNDRMLDGFVDFGKDVNWRTAYAWVTITSPAERKAQLRFDSDDQGKVWLNEKKMYAHRRRNRGAVMDRRTIPVTLRSGKNSILVKVCNETSSWGFYLRITDTDGKPFDDLKIIDIGK
ncbi:tetratricopeptide repeat protein [Candidatus Poribacteria bacterium]|nr:tetratricopeptide repeat protein [Candidatus Poribacteria bacterium]